MNAETRAHGKRSTRKHPCRNFDEKFIQLVRAREAIYNNPNEKTHRKKIAVLTLWQEIANEIGLTVSQCKHKWINMRNSYARHLRCLKIPGLENKKAWYLADTMSFLQDHMKSSNEKKDGELDEDYLILDCTEEQDGEDDTTVAPTNFTQVTQLPNIEVRDGYETAVADNKNLIKTKPKKDMWQSATPDNVTSSRHESFSNITIQEHSERQHPLLQFFTGIIPDYDRLTAKRQRMFKQRSFNVLNDLLDEQEL